MKACPHSNVIQEMMLSMKYRQMNLQKKMINVVLHIYTILLSVSFAFERNGVLYILEKLSFTDTRRGDE